MTWGGDTASGLIPAHAGKTDLRGGGAHERGAHPRSRGENQVLRSAGSGVAGSSPLTRGKRRASPQELRRPGLIPAHAGKTVDSCLDCGAVWAHPRSRGENARHSPFSSRPAGSSPLTRGKLHVGEADGEANRLIPAHAGKTREAGTAPPGGRAHPRSRGENLFPQRADDSF